MHLFRKQDDVGATPTGGPIFILHKAHVAQQQRRRSQKAEVGGATPSVGTKFKKPIDP